MKEFPDFLTADEVAQMWDLARRYPYVDGRESTSGVAAAVKFNQQLDFPNDVRQGIDGLLATAIGRNEPFRDFTLPKAMSTPHFARYGAEMGGRYGRHLDTALTQRGTAMRSDLSTSIFLSDPSEYEGGELVLETPFGDQHAKLPAGSAVVYPTFYYHEVTKVTRGERLVLIAWIESWIANPQEREILAKLTDARRQVMETAPDSEVFDLLHLSVENLKRLWGKS